MNIKGLLYKYFSCTENNADPTWDVEHPMWDVTGPNLTWDVYHPTWDVDYPTRDNL